MVTSAVALVPLAVGLTAVEVAHANTQTITVNTTQDGPQSGGAPVRTSSQTGGKCTLRAALTTADQDQNDVIDVPAGVYQLTDGPLPELLSPMQIVGAGSATTIVDGGGMLAVSTVEISGLTIRNSVTLGPGAGGAGIANVDDLTLTDVVLTGNTAKEGLGGGILNFGRLALDHVVVSGNRAEDGGGL